MPPFSHLWGARWPIIFSMGNDQCSLHERHDRDARLWSVMCTEEAYRRAYQRSYRTYRADMCTRLCIAMYIWRQTKSISVHAHLHMCTHAPNGFADNPNKWHARHFIDVISSTRTGRGSSAELFLLLHMPSNSSAHCTKRSKSCA
jgi:hypothetical protein